MSPDDPGDIDVRIGRRIQQIRIARKMTQPQLAQAIGVATTQMQKYEKGGARFYPERLYLAAKALRTSVDTFFMSDEEYNATQTGEEPTYVTLPLESRVIGFIKDFSRLPEPIQAVLMEMVETVSRR